PPHYIHSRAGENQGQLIGLVWSELRARNSHSAVMARHSRPKDGVPSRPVMITVVPKPPILKVLVAVHVTTIVCSICKSRLMPLRFSLWGLDQSAYGVIHIS